MDTSVVWVHISNLRKKLHSVGAKAEIRFVRNAVTNGCQTVDSIQLDRLFERFYREDAARTAGSGFGIGLSIAQAIADRHKSSIRACKAADGVIGFEVRF